MRTVTILLLLSCWTLQPIHAASPEPAPPLKLIIRFPVVNIAHGSYGTALLLQKPGDLCVGACTLNVRRGGRSVDDDLPVPGGQRPEERLRYLPDPYWQQVLCLGKEGTCLVAGNRLRDLVFVPGEKAAADFPDLVRLVRQAWVIGEKNNYFLSFAWTNQARDRLLLLVCQQAEAPSMSKKDVLCYLAKGKKPWVIADKTVGFSPGVDSLSARALFLADGSGVFLSRDGKRLICFPAGQDAGYSLPLPGLCKGMSWQGGQDIRLLMQHKSSILARSLKLIGESAAFGGGKKIADLPEAVSLATPLGEGYWVYPTDERELILWSEEEGPAPAPLVSDIHMKEPVRVNHMWWQVADDGRILYCLVANNNQRGIGSIDTPPASLYQQARQLKKAALSFPVHMSGGPIGFYVAETQKKGTFYSCLQDGSRFSLEGGEPASIPLPFPPAAIKKAAGWLCPDQTRKFQLYLALVIATPPSALQVCGLTAGKLWHSFSQATWRRTRMPRFEIPFAGYDEMQWVVDEETNEPVLVWMPYRRALHAVRDFEDECKPCPVQYLDPFDCLVEGNLAVKRTQDTIHVHRVCAKGGILTCQELFHFPAPAPSPPPGIRAVSSIQDGSTERIQLRIGSQVYDIDRSLKGAESGAPAQALASVKVSEDRDCLLSPAFNTYRIGNAGPRPCMIVDDRKGELSLLHFVPTPLVVTGFLRRLECEEEDLVPDMIRLLVRFLGGAFLALQERTSCRPGLFTWSSHFACPASAILVGKEVKCRSLVPFQQ